MRVTKPNPSQGQVQETRMALGLWNGTPGSAHVRTVSGGSF